MFRNKRTILMVLVLTLALFADVANADYTFGTPTNLGPKVNSSSYEWYPSIRADGLEMYFESNRPGGEGTYDIWVSTRATKEDEWGIPTNLGAPINTPDWQNCPTISADGLELYYNSAGSLWVVRRATVSDPWGEPENDSLININTSNVNSTPCLSSDGLSLYLASWDPWDLYASTRTTIDDLWSEPVNLGPTVNGVNSSTWENYCPAISADGLLLVFSSNRSGGFGGEDLWMTRRTTIDGPWSEPVNLGLTINSGRLESSPEISHDGRSLFFSSNRDGGYGSLDIWQAPIIPIVDFNGDRIVDINDLEIMIESWGTDDSICDIGPMPWGDGIVDKYDLQVFMNHWGEVYTLIAHYKLDEADGNIAYDSTGNYNADVLGNPLWQPKEGYIDGSIELDGIDDYIKTPFILDPNEGEFSVFAWVKGGQSGEVIISQADGTDWLSVNQLDGTLMSELNGEQGSSILLSQTVITEGSWHRVGLTFDGQNRILYVDDEIVAQDILVNIANSVGGLYIGTGKDLEQGTLWTGLIDDVRIYDRLIIP